MHGMGLVTLLDDDVEENRNLMLYSIQKILAPKTLTSDTPLSSEQKEACKHQDEQYPM
jgi:hypothetical protein